MSSPAPRPPIPSSSRQRLAFEALYWVGWTFEAAMNDGTRREIIELIATRWPKSMENIIPIRRIEQLAHKAAGQYASARDANPYPDSSAAGGLFVKCFEAEQNRRKALSQQDPSAIQTAAI